MKPLLILKSYVWLLNTIRDLGPITREKITELWMKDRLSDGNSLTRQTFSRYKNDLEEFFNISIGCDKENRYYIKERRSLNTDSVANWMMSTLSVDFALSNKNNIFDRIEMEYVPSAGRFLGEIAKAMEENDVLTIVYQRYDRSSEKEHQVEPYFLKLYHQRWYLIGRKDDGVFLSFGLDRIKELSLSGEKFVKDPNINIKDFFEDCFGVMKDESKPAEKIILRAYGEEASRLRDLKLHHSQRKIASCDEYSDFELKLRPSLDFVGKILERGAWVEIIEPQHLALEIMQIHEDSVNLYKKTDICSEV